MMGKPMGKTERGEQDRNCYNGINTDKFIL